LRGTGEDFGQGRGILEGVADEFRRPRRSRNFRFHGSPSGEDVRRRFAPWVLAKTKAYAFMCPGLLAHRQSEAAAPICCSSCSISIPKFQFKLDLLSCWIGHAVFFLCVFWHDPGLVCLSAIWIELWEIYVHGCCCCKTGTL
jgi:hypothetical protein